MSDWYEYDEDEELQRYRWLQRQRKRAEDSYKEGETYRYCSNCGELLVCGSMSWMAGEHIDSCD